MFQIQLLDLLHLNETLCAQIGKFNGFTINVIDLTYRMDYENVATKYLSVDVRGKKIPAQKFLSIIKTMII